MVKTEQKTPFSLSTLIYWWHQVFEFQTREKQIGGIVQLFLLDIFVYPMTKAVYQKTDFSIRKWAFPEKNRDPLLRRSISVPRG